MALKQIRINEKSDKIYEVCGLLEQENINIIAVSSIGDVETSSIYIVVKENEKAVSLLKNKGFDFAVDEILIVEVPNHPGGLNSIMKPLIDENIKLKSIYSTNNNKTSESAVVLGSDDILNVEEILKKNWIKLFDIDDF